MSATQQLTKKAKACLAKKTEIPMSPLYHMGMAAQFKKESHLKYVQDALNFLACKAQVKLPFSEDDKEFLVEIYEAFYWGGLWVGYPEAAKLASHYVSMEGNTESNPLMVDPTIYREAPIVIETMKAMKRYILEQKKNNKKFQNIKCSDNAFDQKPYARKLWNMNENTQGRMVKDGVLRSPQNNTRLHRADGHFYLNAITKETGNALNTTWRIDSYYDFEPFEKQQYFSEIPLGNINLIIYDGLSEYMARLGVAKPFWYRMEWKEAWNNS